MEVNFKRDLYHNYMVLSGIEYDKMNSYCIKMLAYQQIEGILSLEIQSINNQDFFYYEITAKQSVYNLFDKTVLSFERVRKIFLSLIDTIERAYDYLLLPDDFLLLPEYVYLDINTDMPNLCYLPGYQKNIKEQMSSFIEYIMNKVDYNDKEAVLLVYRLYAASKEEGYAFSHLKKIIQNNSSSSVGNTSIDYDVKTIENEVMDNEKQLINNTNHAKKEQERSTHFNIPVMMEKVVGEQELYCYPVKTYLYSAICILGGILLLLFCNMKKIIYNSFGNRIEYSKLFALLLVLLCLEGYLMKHIWDKKNRITKMVTKSEYIDPREDWNTTKNDQKDEKEVIPNENPGLVGEGCGLINKNHQGKWINHQEKSKEMNSHITYCDNNRDKEDVASIVEEGMDNEEYNPTCLLSAIELEPSYRLEPIDKEQYETILIKEIPFFIGKIKKNVDYCLEKDVVSRYHAKITEEQDQFFITDLNSTNGTFLNGEVLQPYSSKEVNVGDIISFADIKFIFSKS